MPESYEARLFHATRTLAPERFRAAGILRLEQAIDGIWQDSQTLVPEIGDRAWCGFRVALETGRRYAIRARWSSTSLNEGARGPRVSRGPYGSLVWAVAL